MQKYDIFVIEISYLLTAYLGFRHTFYSYQYNLKRSCFFNALSSICLKYLVKQIVLC